MATPKQTTEQALAQMDRDRAVIQIQGKVKIVGWEKQETTEKDKRLVRMPVFSDHAAMKLFYANQIIRVKQRDGNGETVIRQKPLFDYWLKRADRPTATGFVMHPSPERFIDGALNLWQGLAIEPKQGDWTKLKSHIEDVIASGNEEWASYIMRWFAWVIQHPTDPAQVVLVLRGGKGAGKGILMRLLCYVFGAHAIQISDRKHLLGSFNRHLQQICFLYADEAFWPGDKAGDGPLKRLVTEPTLVIEPKGIDAYEVPNRLSIVMTSNEDWVVPATKDERRYAVFDVLGTRIRDFAYFGALDDEIYREGGAEAFLYHMLHMDLGAWHPREGIPQTPALADQKGESATVLANWLGEILDEGMIPATVRDESGKVERIVHKTDPALARAGLLLHHARAYTHNNHISPKSFWKFLSDHGILPAEDKRVGAGRWRRFPSLQEARATFLKLYPYHGAFSGHADAWRMPELPASWDDYMRWEEQEEAAK